MRQKETEAKFLELSSLSEKLAAIPSEPKKRKRKAKTDSYPQQQDHFATYEAEIQVTFFKKVMHHYFSLCVIVSFFNKFLADITRLFWGGTSMQKTSFNIICVLQTGLFFTCT